MKKQTNKEYWHSFYSKAWDKRMEIAKSIIDTGETDPHRVVKIFESII